MPFPPWPSFTHSACALITATAFLTAGCGTSELPPPAAPDRSPPALNQYPANPPAENEGRVVLDTPGMQANVQEVTGIAQIPATLWRECTAAMITQTVCTTPCVVDLPRGRHQLIFTSTTDESRTSSDRLDLQSKPVIFKHAVGRSVTHRGLTTLGFSSLILGVATLGLSLAAFGGAAKRSSKGEEVGYGVTYGFVFLGTGAVFTTLAALLLRAGRTENQPGATTQWTFGAPSERPDSATPATMPVEQTRFLAPNSVWPAIHHATGQREGRL